MSEKFSDEFDNICDKVRFVKFAGEELDEQMNKHIDECESCRTFFEQSAVLEKELGALGVDTLKRNGKSVADSVMEEIKRQNIFTKGAPAKESKGIFRHFGLVAACIIIAVMALPVMDNVFGTKNQSAEFAKNSINDNDVDLAESDGYKLKNAVFGETDFSDDYVNTEVVCEPEEASLLAETDNEGYNTTSDISSGTLMFKAMPETDLEDSKDAVYNAEKALFDVYESGGDAFLGELEETALVGALQYLDSDAVVPDSMDISFSGDAVAYAVFETEKGDKITVCLEKSGEKWIVRHVCDGDITE